MVEDGYLMITGDKQDISCEARSLVAFIDGYVIQTIIGVGGVNIDETIEKLSRIIDEQPAV